MIPFTRPQLQLNNYGPWLECPDFLSPEQCAQIIAQMPEEKLIDATVDVDGKDTPAIRISKVTALEYNPENEWVFRKLEDAISQFNVEVYGFELAGFHEAIQLMQYKVGSHYDWHADLGNKQFSQRKLSFSVQLTDSKDYEGGELEFFNNGLGPRDQGTLILFPSYQYHRVRSVTKGMRRALVGWIAGMAPFR